MARTGSDVGGRGGGCSSENAPLFLTQVQVFGCLVHGFVRPHTATLRCGLCARSRVRRILRAASLVSPTGQEDLQRFVIA